MTPDPAQPGSNWSRAEVEACVADYLAMLVLERSGQSYSKTEHRRQLLQRLPGRTAGAVELKHQNISAILLQLNCPPIDGYKPRGNYQKLLLDVVSEQIKHNSAVDVALAAAVDLPATSPTYPDFDSIWTEAPAPPPPPTALAEPDPDDARPWYTRLVQRDYLQREAMNRSLGEAGELLIVDLERQKLVKAGQQGLAAKVLHVSREMGDGAGFDIRSFHEDGTERYIEVKTTAFVRETPFFISQREVEVSRQQAERYSIYRLFNFRRNPRLFELRGDVRSHCRLDAFTLRASFA